MFSLVWIFNVVEAGTVTVGQLEFWTAFNKPGASSPPLAVTVHALVAAGTIREAAAEAVDADKRPEPAKTIAAKVE
jgi:hypothetical protein